MDAKHALSSIESVLEDVRFAGTDNNPGGIRDLTCVAISGVEALEARIGQLTAELEQTRRAEQWALDEAKRAQDETQQTRHRLVDARAQADGFQRQAVIAGAVQHELLGNTDGIDAVDLGELSRATAAVIEGARHHHATGDDSALKAACTRLETIRAEITAA